MTIRIPPDNLIDKLLNRFGIERAIIFPDDIDSLRIKYGHHVHIRAKHESLLKTILRQYRKKKQDSIQ